MSQFVAITIIVIVTSSTSSRSLFNKMGTIKDSISKRSIFRRFKSNCVKRNFANVAVKSHVIVASITTMFNLNIAVVNDVPSPVRVKYHNKSLVVERAFLVSLRLASLEASRLELDAV